VDSGASAGKAPTTQGYSAGNTTPSYTLVGATGIATINAPGYQASDAVYIQFTSGTLGTTAPYNTVRPYTVLAGATSTAFTVNIGNTTFGNITSGAKLPHAL